MPKLVVNLSENGKFFAPTVLKGHQRMVELSQRKLN